MKTPLQADPNDFLHHCGRWATGGQTASKPAHVVQDQVSGEKHVGAGFCRPPPELKHQSGPEVTQILGAWCSKHFGGSGLGLPLCHPHSDWGRSHTAGLSKYCYPFYSPAAPHKGFHLPESAQLPQACGTPALATTRPGQQQPLKLLHNAEVGS